VSGLEDPMVFGSIDHAPFMGGGADWSVTIEQRFPLSGVRGDRERAARAEARGMGADVKRAALDVELEVATAFAMLREERAMAVLVTEQKILAEQIVVAATARYGAGKGAQAEVLRAELEVARLAGEIDAKAADVRAAEAMLDASLGRDPTLPVPALLSEAVGEPPRAAIDQRPELATARAGIERYAAEVSVMDDMYSPMAVIQTGPSFTMADRYGWMVMVGISIPLYRDKLKAGVREAEAMRDMARQDLVAMQQMFAGEAAVARERVIAARTRFLTLRDQIVPKAKAAIDPTLAAYSTGQLPLVGVLEAVKMLRDAQMELVKADRDLGTAAARFARATGESK